MKPLTDGARVKSLDALRGTLALCVFGAHACQTFLFPLPEIREMGMAPIGIIARMSVVAFFVVSGFAITQSITTNIAIHSAFSIREFTIQRVFRILPPLIAVILLAAVLETMLAAAGWNQVESLGAARRRFDTSVIDQIIALITLCTRGQLTGNWLNGPLWSLTYEIQAYVVAGLVAHSWRGSRGQLIAALGVVLYLVLVASRSGFVAQLPLQAMCMGAFACGVSARLMITTAPRIAYLLATGCFGGGLLVAALGGAPWNELDRPVMLASQLLAASGMAWTLICIRDKSFGGTSMKAIGRISYTLYIAHFPLMLATYFVLWHGDSSWLGWPMVITSVVMTSAVVLYACVIGGQLLERPQQQRWFIARCLARGRSSASKRKEGDH